MARTLIRAALAAALGIVAVTLSYSGTTRANERDDEKLPDIAEIMKKGHAKTNGYLTKIGAEAKDGKWDDAIKDAKSLELLGEALGKNKAPKGEAASWDKLSKKYLENTKAVLKAAEDKSAADVKTALGAIGKSCGECHKAHKP
jgi:hypothetical protein